MARDEDQLAPVVGERIVEREARSLDARQRVQPLLELAIERLQLAAPCSVAGGRFSDTMTRPATWNPKSCDSSLSRLRASIVAPATSTTDRVACTTSSAWRVNDEWSPVAPAGSAQGVHGIGARREPRRRGAEDDAGDERQREREAQDERRRHAC